jgi:hypothetical protein
MNRTHGNGQPTFDVVALTSNFVLVGIEHFLRQTETEGATAA